MIKEDSRKLPEPIKRKVCEALRSGKYSQGKFFLNKNNRHCILGVFCEVGGLVKKYDKHLDTYRYEDYDGKLYRCCLPLMFADSIDMDQHGKLNKVIWISSTEYIDTLVCLNDNGYTHKEIADIIEEQF